MEGGSRFFLFSELWLVWEGKKLLNKKHNVYCDIKEKEVEEVEEGENRACNCEKKRKS